MSNDNTTKVSLGSPEFVSWLAYCQSLQNDRSTLAGRLVDELSAQEGRTFIKVIRDNHNQTFSYAWVAREDGQNKELGAWRAGDVFKSASWLKPAKHARGNLFDSSNGTENMDCYGAKYLR